MLSSYQTSTGSIHSQTMTPITLEPARRDAESIRENGTSSATLIPERRHVPQPANPYSAPSSSFDGIAPPSQVRWAGMNTPKPRLALLIAIPALIALGFSGYLMGTWFSGSKVVGCDGTLFNCDHVLNTKWASWLGLPVSGLAVANYVVLLSALVMTQFGSPVRRNVMWSIVIGCCFAAGVAALWFSYLQAFVLKHYCPYCLVAHGCGLVLAIGLMITRPFGMKFNLQMLAVGLMGVLVLAGGQAMGEEPRTYQVETYPNATTVAPSNDEKIAPAAFEAPDEIDVFEAPEFGQSRPTKVRTVGLATSMFVSLMSPTSMVQDTGVNNATQEEAQAQAQPQPKQTEPAKPQQETRRLVSIGGGSVMLDVTRWPIAGNPEADLVFVEMFDYNCGHCRQTHATVKKVKEQLGDKVAVITLPMPLNLECNNQIAQTLPQFAESCKLARLGVAVWKTDQAKYCEFHDWMFTGEKAPSFDQAKAHADTLVDQETLNKILNSPLPSQFIEKHVQVYSRLNKGTIPKLMFKSTSIVGLCQSPDHVIEILNREGPLQPTVVAPQTPKPATGTSTQNPSTGVLPGQVK